jgi:hypothetical protein
MLERLAGAFRGMDAEAERYMDVLERVPSQTLQHTPQSFLKALI